MNGKYRQEMKAGKKAYITAAIFGVIVSILNGSILSPFSFLLGLLSVTVAMGTIFWVISLIYQSYFNKSPSIQKSDATPDYIYCPKCGLELWKGYANCEKCGYKLK